MSSLPNSVITWSSGWEEVEQAMIMGFYFDKSLITKSTEFDKAV